MTTPLRINPLHRMLGVRLSIATALMIGGLFAMPRDQVTGFLGLTGAAAAAYSSRSAQRLLDRGRDRNRKQDYLGALEDFTLALERDPRFYRVQRERAYVHLQLGDQEAALSDLTEVLKCTANPYDYFARACLYQEQGRQEDSLSDLDQFLRMRPQNAFARVERAKLRAQQGHYLEAITDLDEALVSDPHTVTGYLLRAQLRCYVGDMEGAIADFSKVIQIYPTAAAHYNRGVSYYHADRLDLALADLDQALALRPTFVAASFARGNIRYELGEMQGALDDYHQALHTDPHEDDVDPTDEHGLFARALALAHLGDPESALQEMQRAIQIGEHHNKRPIVDHARHLLKRFEEQQQRLISDTVITPTNLSSYGVASTIAPSPQAEGRCSGSQRRYEGG